LTLARHRLKANSDPIGADDIKDALFHGNGQFGVVLRSVLAYEKDVLPIVGGYRAQTMQSTFWEAAQYASQMAGSLKPVKSVTPL